MYAPKQFHRDADGFFLEVQLQGQAISFLLASNNQDQFYQLRLIYPPPPVRHLLPTISHFFFYLLKNYNHPKAFKITKSDENVMMYVNVPTQGAPIQIVLTTNKITGDSIVPRDVIQEAGGVQEVKKDGSPQVSTQPTDPYFSKRKKRDLQACYYDLEEETPKSDASGFKNKPIYKKEEQKNIKICKQAEKLLSEGLEMGQIKQRLRLSDRTAWKMYQQYQRYRRILTPQQTLQIRRIKEGKLALRLLQQQNPLASSQILRTLLQNKGIRLSLGVIDKCVCEFRTPIKNEIYEQSESMVLGQ